MTYDILATVSRNSILSLALVDTAENYFSDMIRSNACSVSAILDTIDTSHIDGLLDIENCDLRCSSIRKYLRNGFHKQHDVVILGYVEDCIESVLLRNIDKADDVVNKSNCIFALSHFYFVRSKLNVAFSMCQLCLESRRKVLGDRHVDTLEALHMVGRILQQQGNLIEAESLLEGDTSNPTRHNSTRKSNNQTRNCKNAWRVERAPWAKSMRPLFPPCMSFRSSIQNSRSTSQPRHCSIAALLYLGVCMGTPTQTSCTRWLRLHACAV